VRTQLTRQSYETYCPLIRARNNHAGLLFPGYVFVHSAQQQWHPLFCTLGVLRVLMAGNRPAQVEETVITELRNREDKDGFVRLPRRPAMRPGQPVRIIAGSFAGLCGLHQQSTSEQRIRILLDFLGRKVSVDLPVTSIVEELTTSCTRN
jgi:transcriptional antiterminator RfaH